MARLAPSSDASRMHGNDARAIMERIDDTISNAAGCFHRFHRPFFAVPSVRASFVSIVPSFFSIGNVIDPRTSGSSQLLSMQSNQNESKEEEKEMFSSASEPRSSRFFSLLARVS